VTAPRAVRLPPPAIFRVTTAGRRACSARQLVASSVASKRKAKMAGNSTLRCAANRSTPATVLERPKVAPSRAMRRPPRHRHAVRGDGPRAVPIPQRESLAQHRLHLGGQRGARMILPEEATPAQQMQDVHRPIWTRKRRTTGRTIGRSSWY
jgi:hypothetical protein